jgi:hemolysin III
MPKQPPQYHPKEERLNVISHAIGLIFSGIALLVLLIKSAPLQGYRPIFSFSVFGASLVLLYAASTFYHSTQHSRLRYYLNIIDHAAIYVLIAGTYTPFALITLRDAGGTFIFFLIWGIAATGTLLKLFFIGRFNLLSTLLYVAMGWLVIFYLKPLIANFPIWGLFWLFAGGFFYTAGAVIYMLEKISYNHAVFHLFVLAGSFSHFIAIYVYML